MTNPICRRFFTLFRVLGTLVLVASLILDYLYAVKQTFSSKDLYVAYLGILALRCIIPLLICLKNVCRKVCNKHNNTLTVSDQADLNDEEITNK